MGIINQKAVLVNQPVDWKIVSTATYTLQATDSKLAFTHASGCTVTVPSTLPTSFECSGIGMDADGVDLVAGVGATLLPGAVSTSAAGATFAILGTPTAGTFAVTGAVA